jgi:hypothetical protein
MEDVDFSGLQEIFRERFLRRMLRRQKVRPETVERMRGWEHSGFAVNWQRKLEAEDRQGLEGLLSYMERAPVVPPPFDPGPHGMPRSSPSRELTTRRSPRS